MINNVPAHLFIYGTKIIKLQEVSCIVLIIY